MLAVFGQVLLHLPLLLLQYLRLLVKNIGKQMLHLQRSGYSARFARADREGQAN